MSKVKIKSSVDLQKTQKPIRALKHELESSKGEMKKVKVVGGRGGDMRGCKSGGREKTV